MRSLVFFLYFATASFAADPTPTKVLGWVGADVGRRVPFNERWYLHPTDQSFSEMEESHGGRCEDIAGQCSAAVGARQPADGGARGRSEAAMRAAHSASASAQSRSGLPSGLPRRCQRWYAATRSASSPGASEATSQKASQRPAVASQGARPNQS